MRIETCLHYIYTTVIALALCVEAAAQAKFSTVVNEKNPGLSDYVQVEYTIENAKSVERISPPSFRNFKVIQGPIQSNGVSYTNGVLSQFKSITYVLQPLISGKLMVPGATALIDGKAMRSEPVVIEVTGVGANKSKSFSPGLSPAWPNAPNRVEEEYLLRPGETIAEKVKNNLFVKTDVNKTTCYEGEPIMVTFKLCSRLRSESKVLKRPSLNGFSVYDMVEPEDNSPTVQTINGKPFNVHIIRKAQLFPLQAGRFTIDPVELDNTVKFLKTDQSQSTGRSPMQQLLDEFLNDENSREAQDISFSLASKPVTVIVKPLPTQNKPAGFNGAVGKFTMQAEMKRKTISAGDAIVLRVQIKGEGNFTVINPPPVNSPAGIEQYDPAIKETVDKTVYPLTGSKTFDYTFIGRDTGNYKIPAIFFSYFDPSEGRYKTLKSDSFSIRVFPSKKTSAERTTVGADRPRPSTWIDQVPIYAVIGMLVVIFFMGLGIYYWKKNQAEKKAAVKRPGSTGPGATTVATDEREKVDPLHEAKRALEAGSSQRFYREVNSAIWKKLSAKLNIPSTELNKINASSRLRVNGADPEMVLQLQAILNECEISLYTPVASVTDMQEMLAKAQGVMKALG